MLATAVLLAPLAPQAAGAATTMGAQSLAGTPVTGAACPGAAKTCTTVLTGARAPVSGVVTGWRIRALAGQQQLTLLAARASGSTWRAAAVDATPQTIAGGAIESFSARLPVTAGDALALEASSIPSARDPLAGGPLAVFSEALGSLPRAPDTTLDGGLLVQADVEPDADGDGFGDETQDACPAEPARQVGPCAAAAVSVATVVAPQ
ncbi:MAG: hypothetical protein QOI11_465, partial [Candidatus Eremiobacteraeota bacterium]|nr:hypothetical protein [Candidatus Eremiobacteraeota bacterium]